MAVHSLQYHHQTSYFRTQMTGHALDWVNQPSVYKTYPETEVISLPENPLSPEFFLSQVLKDKSITMGPARFSLKDLSQIFRLSYSLTAKAAVADGIFYYRSVASAGALYPTEIYLAVPEGSELKEGLYHYSIALPGLSPLREGNFVSFIQQKALWSEDFTPGLTFFFTAIFSRSSWKYRDRAFRYHLLDAGHLIENIILALRAHHLPVNLTFDFDDSAMNRFLGLDETLEGSLAMVSLPGERASEIKGGSLSLPELSSRVKEASRMARQESRYPLIKEIYEAGRKLPPVKASIPSVPPPFESDPERWIPFNSPEEWPQKLTFPETIFRRRSKRNFVPNPLPSQVFDSILEGFTLPVPALFETPGNWNQFLSLGLLTGSVEGVLPGCYLFDKGPSQIGLVKEGDFTKSMAKICLEQMWLANASLHFLFIANLDILESNWGPRGYRYAMMTAGRMGERLYLLSTALGLGCCGIGAFFDQEAAELLGLDAENRLLYLVAVGLLKRKSV